MRSEAEATERALRRQIAELGAENEQLRRRLEFLSGPKFVVPPEWRLTKMEAQLFSTLMERPGFVSKDDLMQVLYSDSFDEPDDSIIHVRVCHMRKKLKPHGVTILSRWGQGYEIEGRAKLRSRLAAANDNADLREVA